ncbi:C-C motif chemokine 20a.3 [Salarias fasciatus]|uniref:C-C motif chemokine n=1 Tax=Salarias fasciatus TaxID=181472 RepID=A0A672F737_SALFA|nr:C-C motif chemokine 20-like [Salarias fasciatus]
MASVRVRVMLMVLLSVCHLLPHSSAVYYECCRKYSSTKIAFVNIRGYSVQTMTEMCPINAIIFHTKRGRVCTNPALNWVMDYIDRLRRTARMVHMRTAQFLK